MTDETPDIDKALQAADATFNASRIGEVILGLMQANPLLTLDKIEERFRALGVKTHLVARPAKIAPAGLHIINPVNDKPAKFWIWICLHGEQEAIYTIWTDDLARTDNLTNLRETGFLVAGDLPPQRASH